MESATIQPSVDNSKTIKSTLTHAHTPYTKGGYHGYQTVGVCGTYVYFSTINANSVEK